MKREGHVLFDVAKKADYGKLSRRPLDEMIAGARVDVAPYKREADGFRAVEAERRATRRAGIRPGAAGARAGIIECSAMIEATIAARPSTSMAAASICVFPHHENEIAQSEGAHHGHPLASVWMHNGFLQCRRREDVEVARQLRDHPRTAGGLAGRRAALQHAARALPPADGLDRWPA